MSQINIVIAHYEDCKKDLIDFRNANRDVKRDACYFNWRYLERPGEQKPIVIWAVTEQGEKIGSISLIPHQYMINNNLGYIGLLGDISVAKAWRGKGIAQQMFKYLSRTESVKQLSACLVLPNEAAARSLVSANWRSISMMNRYVKLIDVEKRLSKLLRVAWFSKPASLLLNVILKAVSIETYAGQGNGYKEEVVSGFDERFDSLWRETKKDSIVMGLRNMKFLTWRYAKHPLVDYQIFTLMHNSLLCGFIVYHCDGDSCYIDDMLFLNGQRKHSRYLLSKFIRYMRTVNINDISLTINKNEFFDLKLSRYGFIRRFSNWQAMVFVDNSKKEELLLNGQRWFLTAGDKDV